MGKVTREWRKAKVLNWNLHLFQLLEIIQVLDSISWVRCASGNVCFIGPVGYDIWWENSSGDTRQIF